MQLIIGNQNYSSWSLRPWFFMRLFDVQFETIKLRLFTDEFHDVIDRYSPSRKVPALNDNLTTVWDSLAICEYINEAYLNGRGWPEEATHRAHARAISCEMHSSFPNIRSKMPMDCRREQSPITIDAALSTEIQRMNAIWSQCREEHHSKGPWLFGLPSIADAMFAPIAIRFDRYAIKGLSPICSDYVDFLLNHPALIEWIEQGKTEVDILSFD
jgi:glutathione S-transferase